MLALFEASLPVALVSPQRVRQYARAKGLLARTDQIDAQILADFGQKLQPRVVVGRSEERRRLSALVGRRKQLNAMLQAEKNRLRMTSVDMKTSLKRVIACLQAEMKELEKEIHQFMKTHENLREQEKLLRSAKSIDAVTAATLTGIRYNPILKPQYDQLVKRGKEKKVAITACMRKMLTILNAMMRDRQPFRCTASAEQTHTFQF